eukprot:scaffold2907_cov161-Amphora_coffeaeformis.AAC.10
MTRIRRLPGTQVDPPKTIEPSDPQYDIIIVGAGTAAMGCLYGLLEEAEKSPMGRIAILESGPRASDNHNQLQDWYSTAHSNKSCCLVGEAKLGSRRVEIPQGRGRGGTTRINAGLCCSWTTEERDDDTLPRAMQHLRAVLHQNGVFEDQPVPIIVNPSNGRRVDYHQGLIEPLGRPEGVEWIDGATCRRVLYKNNQITGVEYTTNGDGSVRHQLYATRVILAAGVFASPVILAASGLLGNDDHVVGMVQDHVMIPAAFFVWPSPTTSSSTNETLCFNGVKSMHRVDLNQEYTFQISEMDVSVFSNILPSLAVDYLFRRTAWDGWEWVVHPVGTAVATLLRLFISWTPLYWFLKYCVKVVAVFLVRSPTAFNGSFCIRRQQDQNYGVMGIQLDYLRSDRDLAAVRQFWTEFMSRPTRGWEFFPGPLVRSNFDLGAPLHEDRFRLYCQEFCLPYFHWCGSLAATDPTVSFPHGLFVCDASTLHPLPPVPPALTLAARGYVLAQDLVSQAKLDR